MKSANEVCAVVDFLESATAAALEVRRLHRRLEGLDERRGKLRIQKGAAAKKIEKMLATEREREVQLIGEELKRYRRVEEFVARVPERAQRTILRRRYLDIGKSWDEIQSDLARDGVLYSPRHLQRLHTQALRAAQKLWDEEGR
ncbi:MAG: hypothetical protein IKM11_03145 [Oscillospiraceae bacterium]|nr:hypothetical protein [Oscillospiraceae bacterium]